jgi:hypothetical protein
LGRRQERDLGDTRNTTCFTDVSRDTHRDACPAANRFKALQNLRISLNVIWHLGTRQPKVSGLNKNTGITGIYH